jgi:hypothetical protein
LGDKLSNNIYDIHIKAVKLETERHRGLSNAIMKSMNRRNYLKKKAIKTNSTACHDAYNEINKIIMYAKRAYYTNCDEKNRNSRKQMWKHINQLVIIKILGQKYIS